VMSSSSLLIHGLSIVLDLIPPRPIPAWCLLLVACCPASLSLLQRMQRNHFILILGVSNKD
jgi:hypothetical protein